MQWWTGEDSNLRSPQGAADLQSAGFSHSPTRPGKIIRDAQPHPANLGGTPVAHSLPPLLPAATPYRSARRSGVELRSRRNTNRTRVKGPPAVHFFWQDCSPSPPCPTPVELAEGIEPPTL